MSNDEIIRSWKSEEENTPETPAGQGKPKNPAGEQELSDKDLESVEGGAAQLQNSCLATTC